MKRKVSVTIDQSIYEKAHSLGLNVSKISENALLACIEALNNRKLVLSQGSFAEESWAGPLGFEPRTFSLEGFPLFREFLKEKKYNRTWESTLYNYALAYAHCLEDRNLSEIQALPVSKRANVLKAVSAYAKFKGEYNLFRQLVSNYKIPWAGRSKSDVFIDRLTRDKDSEEIWGWIKQSKEARPELRAFFDLMAVSGLRFAEAVNSYSIIQEGPSEYYNVEAGSLEHWRYPETFIRSSKKAFVSFIPHGIIEDVKGSAFITSAAAVQCAMRRAGLPCRFGDIREAHGTLMVKYLKESEIDFLHGRVTGSVFKANYFNPALIADLRERVFKGVAEILEKVKI